jgi:hypothetical protein
MSVFKGQDAVHLTRPYQDLALSIPKVVSIVHVFQVIENKYISRNANNASCTDYFQQGDVVQACIKVIRALPWQSVGVSIQTGLTCDCRK